MGYAGLVEKQKAFFDTGKTKKTGFRLFYLNKLLKWMEENENQIAEALNQDSGRSGVNENTAEIESVKEDIRYTMKHLTGWVRPRRVKTLDVRFPSASFVYKEPYGVVLIMTPWNYPFQLTILPLIGAISAGNCVVLKPSTYSVHTLTMIKNMIREVFPTGYVTVVTGTTEENEELLNEKFDYIFF